MPARLTVYLADRPARALVLREEEEYVLGRDATSTLVVDDDRVSRRHARLRRGREGWELSDLASKNGTLVNGPPVAGRALLAPRSWLSLGGVLASFEPLTEEQSRAESSAESERRRSTVAARRRLAAADSLDAILQGLLESVVQLSGAERGFVLLARGDGDLAVAAASGLAAFDLGAAEFSGSIGAVERALATGRAVAVGPGRAGSGLRGPPPGRPLRRQQRAGECLHRAGRGDPRGARLPGRAGDRGRAPGRGGGATPGRGRGRVRAGAGALERAAGDPRRRDRRDGAVAVSARLGARVPDSPQAVRR